MNTKQKLTKTYVESLTEPGDYRDTEIKGFICRVRLGKNGEISRTYLYVGKKKGSQKNISVAIGKHGNQTGDKSNKQARDEAEKIRQSLKNEINPTNERRERTAADEAADTAKKAEKQRLSLTLREVRDDYLQTKKLKEKTHTDYVRFTDRCVSDWLDKPIVTITKDMILARHKLLSEHPAQADYTMRILRALFTFAGIRYEIDGKTIVEQNPVKILSQLKTWNPKKVRDDIIEEHEMAAWFQAVEQIENKTAAAFIKVLLFTGLRDSEGKSLRWSNIDFKKGTLRIPAEVSAGHKGTKNKQDHVVHMSTYLRTLLKNLYDERTSEEWVFPSNRSASGHIEDARAPMQEVTEICGKEYHAHDLRHTFETIAESLDLSGYVQKKLLNHTMTNDVTAGYIKFTPERLRDAMQKITDKILEVAKIPHEGIPETNVVQMKRAK